MVNHYKSHITKLELEKEDLKRELSRKMHKVGFPMDFIFLIVKAVLLHHLESTRTFSFTT